jgi:hypothetical protein
VDQPRQRELMATEYAAWRQMCDELVGCGVDLNHEERLASAIKLWGEELHQLRLGNPGYDEKALSDAREMAKYIGVSVIS